ncbi:peptidoglycan-binding protein [Teichococcus oryzae]|uniref:Glycoside hydrolase family 19 protein n=1 Tax=Teichococcus oryzae TaxID=1608942 RepID=A0A5B2TKJ4_9PROT|nr:peptidoglycan-binding protein [Pseudoroseomonas oryzae]KAA2214972.1 glycoside hydrolase family 19 protein [Pseudoroseomonas oryzae]
MLTLSQLRQLYPSARHDHVQAFTDQSGPLFRRAGLDATALRCHFFLAQTGHESDGLRARAENLSYSAARLMQVWPGRFPSLQAALPFAGDPEKLAEKVYGGRMGNDRPGDGFRFRGRGYIQITGRDAYREIGLRTGLDLEAEPDLANEPAHALAVACGYWAWKRLNAVADAGDYAGLTRRINGGLVGLQDRFAWLERVQRCMPWPAPAALSIATLKAVQSALKARGLYDGSVDGVIGRRSLAAIATFRAEAALAPGTELDDRVLEALGVVQAVPLPGH